MSTTSNGEVGPPVASGLTGTAYTYTIPSYTFNQTYYFKMTAVYTDPAVAANANPSLDSAESAMGAESSIVATAPLVLSASSVDAHSITLTWTSVGATSYTLTRTSPGGPTVIYSGNLLTFTDTGLTANTMYSYSITSSPTSNTATANAPTYPLPPTNLAAVPDTSVVHVSWTTPSQAGDQNYGYKVYRSTTNPATTSDTLVGTVPEIGTPATTLDDTGAFVPGTTYYYTVQTFAGALLSTLASPDAQASPPAVPTLTAVGMSGGAQVSWSGSTSGYNKTALFTIYRSQNNTGPWTSVITSGTAGSQFNSNSLTSPYYYYVLAQNALGSAQSAPIPVVTPPQLTNVRTFSNLVQIYWNGVAGATSYNIYRSPLNSPGGPFTLVSAGVTNLYYTDNFTVGTNHTYYYVVTAVAGGSESGYSNEGVAGLPPAPILDSVVPLGNGVVQFSYHLGASALGGISSCTVSLSSTAGICTGSPAFPTKGSAVTGLPANSSGEITTSVNFGSRVRGPYYFVLQEVSNTPIVGPCSNELSATVN
jgi:fibronectin type 3 domain-containing protein